MHVSRFIAIALCCSTLLLKAAQPAQSPSRELTLSPADKAYLATLIKPLQEKSRVLSLEVDDFGKRASAALTAAAALTNNVAGLAVRLEHVENRPASGPLVIQSLATDQRQARLETLLNSTISRIAKLEAEQEQQHCSLLRESLVISANLILSVHLSLCITKYFMGMPVSKPDTIMAGVGAAGLVTGFVRLLTIWHKAEQACAATKVNNLHPKAT